MSSINSVALCTKRKTLLLGTEEHIRGLQNELLALHPELEEVIGKRVAEMGESSWLMLLRRLMLQVYDMLWVEHLEVMQYARGNVSLRAYAQQDPLIEYRREAVRLFKEMQGVAESRICELIPRVRIEAVTLQNEEEERKRQKLMELGTGNSGGGVRQEPIRKKEQFERNALVTITNGTETQTLKYKKAEQLIAGGGWTIVAPQ